MEALANTLRLSSDFLNGIEPPRDYHLADWKYEVLKEQIEDFQSDLSDDLDVCVQLAYFGSNIVMFVDEIGYQNPDLLYFHGTYNGQRAQLIQNAAQLNFLLLAVPKTEPEKKPRRIGFFASDNEE